MINKSNTCNKSSRSRIIKEKLHITSTACATFTTFQQGMSLLEILVVITIFAILGILVTRSILLTLRGTTRSEATLRIRENVNYAMSVIERQIRNANSVSPCPNSDPTILNYTDQNGNLASFSCVGLGTTDSYLASGSASLGSARLTNTNVKLTNCILQCNLGTSTNPSSVSVSIQARDSLSSGIENPAIFSSTTIQLRNY